MSSHREAPAISKDPVADNTDLYAFVDPSDTSKVTFLANFIPLEEPAGGPNFFQFGDEVLYEILIDNDGDGEEDVVYQFRFKTVVQNPGTFLYNTGPISSLTDPNWNVRQSYTVNRVQGDRDEGQRKVLGSDWTEVDAGLRILGECRGAGSREWCEDVRGAAGRRVLRRLGLHLRPGGLASVPEPTSNSDPGCPRRERHERLQCPHDRDPGPEDGPDEGRVQSHGPRRSSLRDRRVVRREATEGAGPGEARSNRGDGTLGPSLPSRRASYQRSGHRTGREGSMEQHAAGGRCAVPR